MCLTLRNAVRVLDHDSAGALPTGITRTLHPASYLEPGDIWIPANHGRTARAELHTVTEIHHDQAPDVVVVVDQYGDRYSYRHGDLIRTAVRDPLPHHSPATTALTDKDAPC